jgi:hypothetical protein
MRIPTIAYRSGEWAFLSGITKQAAQQIYLHKFNVADVLENLRQLLAVTSPW